jgi:hypothetical protein
MASRRGRGARPTVERTIRFYRIDAGQDEDGSPIPFETGPALEFLAELRAEGDFYLERPGKPLLCYFTDSMNAPQQVRLAAIRRSDLPEVEEGGNLEPLVIPANAGLAEQTHLVFFEDGVVGADFNFYGPRASAFRYYHNAKTHGEFAPISVDPLLRADVAQSLARLEDVRMLRLKIRRPYLSALAQANESLAEGFRAAMDLGNAEEAELILKPRAYSRGSLGSALLTAIRRLARRDDLRNDDVRAFQVTGYDPAADTVEEIDILHSHLLTTKQIVRLSERTNGLDSRSAYGAIQSAYDELHEDIQSAVAIFGY